MEARKTPFPKLTQRFLQTKMRMQQKTQSIYDEHFSEAQLAKHSRNRLTRQGINTLSGDQARQMIGNLISAPIRNTGPGLGSQGQDDPELTTLQSRLLNPESTRRSPISEQSPYEILSKIEQNFEKLLVPAKTNRVSDPNKKNSISSYKRSSHGGTHQRSKPKRSKRVKTEPQSRPPLVGPSNLAIDRHQILEIGDILGTGKKDLPENDN